MKITKNTNLKKVKNNLLEQMKNSSLLFLVEQKQKYPVTAKIVAKKLLEHDNINNFTVRDVQQIILFCSNYNRNHLSNISTLFKADAIIN